MRTIFHFPCFGVAFCALALLCGAPLAQAAEAVLLRFAYETKDVPPYFIGDGEQIPAKPGVTPELMRLLETKIPGLKVQLQRMPWKRCLSSLQSGESDAVVASFNKERRSLGHYPMKGEAPDPALRIDTKAYFLYSHVKSKISWNGRQFSGVNGAIGAPLGYSIVEDLKNQGLAVEESKSAQQLLEKLSLQRVAAVALLERVGDALLQDGAYPHILKHPAPLAGKDYYVLLSQTFVSKYPAMARQIWQAVAQLREQEGEALIKQYLALPGE
ncbi:transporter substrate-binding domain-containing protein [Massilia sp. W12]|uniref:substrate-binding periplasmic protein n=1 Tax=Massilia sp. W12 TaxID=3126507 RepID=UPI0030CCCFDB